MAAFTSKADGNWSASGQTTWNETGVPTDGDTVTVAHNVTVDANTTVGSDSGAAITLGATGGNVTLTVATGVTLLVKGDVLVPSPKFGTLTVAAGGTFAFYPASAATNKFETAYVGRVVCNGSSGSRATFKTDKSRGGNNGYILATVRPGLVTATYTDFTDLGSATYFGVQSDMYGPGYDGDLTITNCTFLRCNMSLSGRSGWDDNLTFSDNTFTSSIVGPAVSATIHIGFDLDASAGTRVVTSNDFDGMVYFETWRQYKVDHCIFRSGYGVLNGEWAEDEWADNIVILSGTPENLDAVGTVKRTYYINTLATGNPHYIAACPTAASTFDECLVHAPNDTSGTGDGFFAQNGHALTVTRCIVLPNSVGKSSGKLVNASVANAALTVEHCTHWGEGGEDGMIQIGESGTPTAGAVASCRSNIVASSTPGAGGTLAVKDWTATPTHDAVTLAGYNGFWNPDSGTISVNGTPTAINGYDRAWVTSSSQIGVGDVTGNPQFVDSTRNALTWSAYKGGPGTLADALAKLSADRTLISSDLMPWIRAGFAPTNATFHNTGHDGTDIGAVAYAAPAKALPPFPHRPLRTWRS